MIIFPTKWRANEQQGEGGSHQPANIATEIDETLIVGKVLDPFAFWDAIFSGAFAVSFREGI